METVVVPASEFAMGRALFVGCEGEGLLVGVGLVAVCVSLEKDGGEWCLVGGGKWVGRVVTKSVEPVSITETQQQQ